MTIKTSSIPGEFTLLANDEVDEINATYLALQGDLVESWAKCSALSYAIAELEKENAALKVIIAHREVK